MNIFAKHPSSPEIVKALKAKGKRVIEITTKRIYIMDGKDSRPDDELFHEWFVLFAGASHAYRDSCLVGNSERTQEVVILSEDNKKVNFDNIRFCKHNVPHYRHCFECDKENKAVVGEQVKAFDL